MTDAAQETMSRLLTAARLSAPHGVAQLLADEGRALGARSTTLYLIDTEQYRLVPVPRTGSRLPEQGQAAGGDCDTLLVESTLAGRCFRQLQVLQADAGRRVWVPVRHGLERLGVLELQFPAGQDQPEERELHAFSALVAERLLLTSAYGDLFHQVRRTEPMSLAAEVAWHLLPPVTFGTDQLVVACMLAPAYDVGGDSFDYAVNGTTAHLALFVSMGHGLAAGWLATLAIAAYRNSRRHGDDLPGTVRAVDAALAEMFDGKQFVTAVLAELELDTGRLRWHLAGHPAPLLLRRGRVVKSLAAEPGLPLGLGGAREISQQSLEPEDRLLLFTDGVTEARDGDGQLFGVQRLSELVMRQAAGGQPAPETMRRLMHAILAHQVGPLTDDATTMLVEWRADTEQSGTR